MSKLERSRYQAQKRTEFYQSIGMSKFDESQLPGYTVCNATGADMQVQLTSLRVYVVIPEHRYVEVDAVQLLGSKTYAMLPEHSYVDINV